MNDIKHNAEKRMQKIIDSLKTDLSKVRTGRANVGLLDRIYVEYYGNMVPLHQVANITASDSRTLMVTPWEKNMVVVIEKAIINSDLGLNPNTTGNTIRIPMPALTEEQRKKLIKVVRNIVEQTRVAIRGVRRDANAQVKDLLKEKQLSEDDDRRSNEIIQKLTDQYVADVDRILEEKEKDLSEI